MSRKIFAILLCMLFLVSACAQAGTPAGQLPEQLPTAVPGSLYVDPALKLGEISPLVYGSNYGPWVAIPVGMLEDALKLRFTSLRFPGGSWGDRNNLTHLQIDQFIDFCRQMGAEPTISVRLMDGTPEAAAELVRYANLEKGYNVRYWSIGNEPTLFTDAMHEPYDTERFNREWRAIAQAMEAVDPSILLLGPELHQFGSRLDATPKDAQGRDWMSEFLRANGDLVDVVTIHRYPFPIGLTGDAVTIDQLRQNSAEWDQIIPYLRGLIQETTGRDIPIGVTEINTHWSKALQREATPDSHYNAIWWADVLGRMINQDVFLVNHWLVTSSGSQGAWGMVTRGGVRPSYYTQIMYQHFGTQRVYAASGIPYVSVYAAAVQDGSLTVMVINMTDTQQQVSLQMPQGVPDSAELWLFDAAHNAENMGAQSSLSAGNLALSPQSISLYVFAP